MEQSSNNTKIAYGVLLVLAVALVLFIVPISDYQEVARSSPVSSYGEGVRKDNQPVYNVETNYGTMQVLKNTTTVIYDGKMQLDTLRSGFTNIYGTHVVYELGKYVLHLGIQPENN
jgi:hypothetical protein